MFILTQKKKWSKTVFARKVKSIFYEIIDECFCNVCTGLISTIFCCTVLFASLQERSKISWF